MLPPFDMPPLWQGVLLPGVLLLSLLGLAPVTALAAPMGEDEARTLLFRTSFAANETQVQEYARLDRQHAVDRLLAGSQQAAASSPPELSGVDRRLIPGGMRQLSEDEKKALLQQSREQGIALRAWWIGEMLTTPSPFTDKMTLFWHNHFTSGIQKVKSPQLMYRQNVLLRRYALGNFGEMLHAVAHDPAMILYLDNVSNRKGKPNENFAREVMELFTLGEGHYGEQDIRDAARAFTGWGIDRENGGFRLYRVVHDDGLKTVLGKSGNLDGDDVLDILLSRPETAEFIVQKLWREFVSPEPDEREVHRLAQVFRSEHYELRPLMRALLTSDAFYAPQNRATLTKSPVDLIVGTLRQFNLAPAENRTLAFASQQMGQDVFNPPNVKGWPGGEVWINSATLLLRKQALERLLRSIHSDDRMSDPGMRMQQASVQGMSENRLDPQRWMEQFSRDVSQRNLQAAHLLLAATPITQIPADAPPAALLRSLLLDPVYQLK